MEKQTRAFHIDQIERSNERKRTVEASLSSELAVERFWGIEILLHEPGAVDLSRAPLPLLTNHDASDLPIGRVSDLRIENRRLRGTLVFGNSQKAQEVFRDVVDGIITDLSIGYQILETESKPDDTVLVTRWQPYEVSLVAVPADPTVGVGRSEQTKEVIAMPEDKIDNVKVLKNNARMGERNRVADIMAIGKQFDCMPEAERAIKDGTSVDEFRQFVLERLKSKVRPIEPDLDHREGAGYLDMPRGDIERYSLCRAIRCLVDPKFAVENGGVEMEASKALARKLGRETRGILVPLGDIGRGYLKRDLTAGTDTQGGYLVQTDVLAQNFIDVLRNRTFVIRAGARTLSGLRGDVLIPKKSSSSTAYWVDLDGTASITESQPAFAGVQMSPKSCTGLVDISHKLIIQSSLDVENLVRQDLVDTVSVAVDAAAIAGSGTGSEPTGILNTTGIGSNTYSNGGSPSYDDILTLEADVADNNADEVNCCYFTTPTMRKTLKNLYTNSTYGEIPVWTAGDEPGTGKMNGYRAFATKQVTAGYVLFGDFSQVIIGQWNTLELMADPYGSNFAKGIVSVRCIYDVDIAIRHAGAFSELHEGA